MKQWTSLSKKHSVLVRQSDEAYEHFDELAASETGKVILYACGVLLGSIEDTFNPLPTDGEGNLLVNPAPILVAKRS